MPTSTVTITYTGVATAPDNFTITIKDYLNNVRTYDNTNITPVSRASLISGYAVTGITEGDTTVTATSSGQCTTSADTDVSAAGMQFYTPPPVANTYDGPGNYFSFTPNTAAPGETIGTFTTYGFLDPSDFSISHISTSGNGVSGGPLQNFTLVESPAGTFTIQADGKSMAQDTSINYSQYALIYNGNNYSRTFSFYWEVNAA